MMQPLHEGISVTNMDTAIKWYQDVFGGTVIKDNYIPMLNSRVVFLSVGNFQLELFEYQGNDKKNLPSERCVPNEDIKTCGNKHVAWAVENMNTEIQRLKDFNVDIAAGPFCMEGDMVCFIRDNTGNLIELIELGKQP